MITGLGFGLEDTGLGHGLEDYWPWPWPRTWCPRTHPCYTLVSRPSCVCVNKHTNQNMKYLRTRRIKEKHKLEVKHCISSNTCIIFA